MATDPIILGTGWRLLTLGAKFSLIEHELGSSDQTQYYDSLKEGWLGAGWYHDYIEDGFQIVTNAEGLIIGLRFFAPREPEFGQFGTFWSFCTKEGITQRSSISDVYRTYGTPVKHTHHGVGKYVFEQLAYPHFDFWFENYTLISIGLFPARRMSDADFDSWAEYWVRKMRRP